jgi:hypothetical protein
MRALIAMVQANAAFDGLRYRIRFPLEDELDDLGGTRQPIIERENDPLELPDFFDPVTAPWAVGTTLLDGIWCAEVRLGMPTIESIRAREERNEVAEELEEVFEDFDPLRPPLYVEPDGTNDWVTFVLTDAPQNIKAEKIADNEKYLRLEIIVEAYSGVSWVQRPLYDEELDLFEEKNWPVVLRQDLISPRVLTENDVLELHDIKIGQSDSSEP